MSDDYILKISVRSFSIKYPKSHDRLVRMPNFMFDCRGVNNPGRVPEYRDLTGLDKPVVSFLDADESAQAFWAGVRDAVTPAAVRAQERAYPPMHIWFACTGGRHRSVYFAERTAAALAELPGVKVELEHLDKDAAYNVDDLKK